jgi:hypothetical protein
MKKKTSPFATAIAFAIIGTPILWFFQHSDNRGIPAQTKTTIKVGDTYTTTAGNLACPTEPALMQLIGQAKANDKVGFAEMMTTGGGTCLVFPAGVHVSIKSVDMTQTQRETLVEFSMADTPGAGGFWSTAALLTK